MEAVPSTIERRIEERRATILRERLSVVAVAMVAALTAPLLYAAMSGLSVATGITLSAQLVAGAAYLGVRNQTAAWRHPALGLSLMNVMAIAAAGAFYEAFADLGYLQIGVLMLFGYCAVQLETRLIVFSFLYTVLVFLFASRGDLGGVEVMTLVGGVGLGGVLHVANRRFTENGERMRLATQENARALEIALEAAHHQIKERERAEEERERMRERLVEAQRMEAIGTLAGGFAHEMNNLLGGVMGLAHLLRQETTGDVQADAEEILAATKRGAELTRTLLMLSQERALRRDAMSLEAVVTRVATVLGRTLPKRIRLEVVLEGDLTLYGDPSRLEQSLLNLCLNAADAMPGEGVLTVAAREVVLDEARATPLRLSSGSHVALEVRDTGVGMDPPTVRRMFEPFFSTKEKGRGTGLGLAMVYGTVSAHQGVLDVESALGAGTRITAYLPGAPGLVLDAPIPHSSPDRRITVLVVDDEPLLRTTTRRTLERAGFEVLIAEGGAQALSIFETRRDLVVLLDLAMPGMDGVECFNRLRAIDPHARVVLTSGYAFQADVEACLREGAFAFLEKPYLANLLIETLEAASEQASRSAGSSHTRSRINQQRAN